MKITIRKKHLSSLSSLLVLSLIQPSANAETSNTTTSSTPIYDSQPSSEDRSSVKGIVLKNAYRSHSNLRTGATEVKHIVYKGNISQAFEDYHAAKKQLEEQYQDRVDQALDEYEQNLKLSANTEAQTLQAKEDARSVLAQLKLQHKANQEALKLKFHIS